MASAAKSLTPAWRFWTFYRGHPGLTLDWQRLPGGAQHYLDTGTALSDESMQALERCDAILFGAMGLPHIRYPMAPRSRHSSISATVSSCTQACVRYG